jgi:hypothetical protein
MELPASAVLVQQTINISDYREIELAKKVSDRYHGRGIGTFTSRGLSSV